jgi:hypothetical protein
MSGYTRQSAGVIVTGSTIQASDFNNEFNALLTAFDVSAGHTHDGTVGGGAKLSGASFSGLTTSTTGIMVQTAASTFADRVLTGTTNRVTITNGSGVAGNPTIDIDAAYVGQTSITTLGTVTTGTWSGLFGAVSGANLINLTAANISAGTAGISISGNAATASTASAVAASGITGTTLASNVVTSSLTSVGTIATGVWNGTVVGPAFGGTGIANSASQTTTRVGAFGLTQTLTGSTSITYPTSGTLATTGNLSQFAATTSSQLAGVMSDETGSGSLVFATSPTLVTPLLGTPTSGVLTNCTGTAAGLTSGITNALKSATTTVDVSAATAPTNGQVLTATGGTAATWQTPSTGALIQQKSTFTQANINGTTITSNVPFGTGAPASTVGIQVCQVTINVASTTNILVFDAIVNFSSTAQAEATTMVFEGSTLIFSSTGSQLNLSNIPAQNTAKFAVVAGTTGSRTFTLRHGINSATVVSINGVASATKQGASIASGMTISEVSP